MAKIVQLKDESGVELYPNIFNKNATWTPAIECYGDPNPTVTYNNRTGYYLKIGNLVFIEFYVTGKITALNGSTNRAAIGGLPVTPKTGVPYGIESITVGQMYGAVTLETNPTMIIGTGQVRLMNGLGANSSSWKVTSVSQFIIAGSGWYFTD